MQIIKRLYIIIIVFCAMQLNAQQLPQYSNYMINDYAINPAIGGVNPYFEGKSNNRYQWVGITDAPRTYTLSVNGPVKNLNMGLGGLLFTDIVGPTRRTGFYLSYAYQLKLTEKIKLSLGLSGGLLQFMVDKSTIVVQQPDLILNGNLESALVPDFGAGAYAYSTDHKWYVGLSVPQVLQNKLRFSDNIPVTLSKLNTHSYLVAGYNFNLREDIKLEPSLCLKYVRPVPLQFDLGVRAIYQEKFWLGAAFRSHDAISIMVGYIMQKNITFAYSYDITTTSIKKYSTGTHEIMIGIKFYNHENKAPVSAPILSTPTE
jgi:type IX secretion system PorP/SprF family membrane protein